VLALESGEPHTGELAKIEAYSGTNSNRDARPLVLFEPARGEIGFSPSAISLARRASKAAPFEGECVVPGSPAELERWLCWTGQGASRRAESHASRSVRKKPSRAPIRTFGRSLRTRSSNTSIDTPT
jgi:hypothetical protein